MVYETAIEKVTAENGVLLATVIIKEVLLLFPLKRLKHLTFLYQENFKDEKWRNLMKMEIFERKCAIATLFSPYTINADDIDGWKEAREKYTLHIEELDDNYKRKAEF